MYAQCLLQPVTVGTIPGDTVGRICGRVFTAIDDDNTHMATVCSKDYASWKADSWSQYDHSNFSGQSVPFRVQFKSSADEEARSIDADSANNNEQNGAPGGITGFMLSYVQIPC